MPIYTPSSASSDQDSSRMEIIYFSNEFPRDDLQGVLRKLHNHSKDRRHTVLAQFIADATRSVKEEIRTLPKALKACFKPFSTLFQWAEDTELREGPLNGAVDGVLLSVLQLATYIGYAEEHPDELFNFGNTCLTGLGLGLISSTAVALSPTLAELPLAGADAVRLAFRMGILVTDISADLEARVEGESPDSWAYVVHNVEPDEAQHQLDLFNFKERLPETGKISLSAYSRTSVTVSGPPARLKELFKKSQYYRDARSIALPVFGGLCHAPHIYDRSHAQRIVREATLNCNEGKRLLPMTPVYCTSTGKPYVAQDALELLENVILEPLTQPIIWDHVISGIVDRATATCAQTCTIYSFGPSIPLKELTESMGARITEFNTDSVNIMGWINESTPDELNSRGSAQAKLAIVGMSCRLPGGATSTEKFWEVLEKGLDVSRKIPADRFDIDTHYDPTGKQLNKSMTQYMCAIDEPGLFDAPFFNMSPREAQVVDPQMRLALVTAYEALERAGYVANRTASTLLQRIGTWYGQAADDYREVNQGQEVSTYYIPGGCRAFGPGRINYYFKFAGPSYSVDTACSSGLAAIEVACQALWNGEVDTAVTGGMNILTNPDGFAGLNCGHFLTKTHNACKTWDATADGYCRADGIGSLVIKRLEDAEADNDNILGVILGAGTNHSAEAVSITHPHAGHQAYLARQVLRQAGVDPLDVSYVELHGTGTQAGDHEEMQGIMEVYAPLSGRRSKSQPLYIGASKANVGHGESVAGTTALIKTLLMLQKNAIPPHVGIKTEINPRFPKDFDKRNLHIAFEKTTWPQHPGKKRIAAINNFGAAGGNTTMVLEEAPARVPAEADTRQLHVVAVSAKNKTSLAGNLERLQAWIEGNPEVSLADLSYTTTARRQHHNHRVAIAATDLKGLQKELAKKLAAADSHQPIPKSGAPPVAFCFTGQGAAYKSMDLELYREVPSFRSDFNHFDSLAQRQGFPSIIPAVDGSFPKEHAHSPVVTQLSQVCMQMALAKYWASLGIKPDMVLGHSLGEYAAMYVAGVLSANDTIYLVGKRAQLLEANARVGSHQMMAVRASLAQIKEADGGLQYEVACVNGPSDTVLSGTVEQMDAVSAPLGAAGYKCIKLDVAFAFHSAQMDPILDEFEEIARTGVVFKEPIVPVISPLHGKVIFDGKTLNAKYCRDATRGTVNFLGALESAQEISTITEDTVYVEIGAHPVCCSFVKSSIPALNLAVPSFRRGESNWTTIAQACTAIHLAGLDVDWNSYHAPLEKSLTLLDLPTYAWNEKTYWLQYNGDWALTKGNTFYTAEKEAAAKAAAATGSVRSNAASPIKTSTVQNIIEEHFQDVAGTVVMESDLMQADFLAAAHGHKMNGCGVVTSSIHADIAYTLGEYFYKKLNKKAKKVDMNVANLYVSKGLVANANTKNPQCIRVTVTTEDIRTNVANLYWQNVDADGNAADVFAEANLVFGDATEWLSTWAPMTHLVQGRIDALDAQARAGKATRLSHNMAYTLFGKNLVDYHHKYRGMQAVTMNELEAYADVELTTEKGGVWTVPPYFIDSVAHLAGFIMNCSDAIDTQNNYCVTPGWKAMQFAKPLTPGAKYCSYVKMIPTVEDPTVYFGDVYILQDGVIVGMVGGIQFRRFPRILLNKFFSPPDKSEPISANKSAAPLPKPAALPVAAPVSKPTPSAPAAPPMVRVDSGTGSEPEKTKEAAPAPAPAPAPAVETAADTATDTSSVTYKALELIANEAALEISDLEDDVSFAALGIDSLMSLVISEKFRSELDIKVGGSMFLDYPTIGDLKAYTDTL